MVETMDMGIVADDLTGACDVAACFAPAVGPVGVCLSPDTPCVGGPAFQVINTQSRLENPETAHRILHRVGAALAGKQIVFKKIDTGLRGPIGAELNGLVEGLGGSGVSWRCVVAPAAPSIGRTTFDGMQYENGTPIDEGALSNDPNAPPLSANIRTVVEQTGGGDCVICDAQSQDDLRRVVDTHWGRNHVIFAGSLGLAVALSNRLRKAATKPSAIRPARRPLILCGSCHPKSVGQAERARNDGAVVLGFDPVQMRFNEVVSPIREEVLVVCILPNDCRNTTCSPQHIMRKFVTALGPLLEEIDPDGLGIIGGETAYHVLRCLDVNRLDVIGRVNEVISCGIVTDGHLEGCPFAMKGGSVGPDDAVMKMVGYLRNGTLER
jgi:D-threonate/D-erythronate kinase